MKPKKFTKVEKAENWIGDHIWDILYVIGMIVWGMILVALFRENINNYKN